MRLTQRLIEAIDTQKGTSYLRQIEMTVDQVVTHYDPAYGVQFWRDVAIYGLKEAMMYLDGFVKSKGGKGYDHKDEFNDLSVIRAELENLAPEYKSRLVRFR